MKVVPLLQGAHINNYLDYGIKVYPLTSSVVLLQHEGKNILIDSGMGFFEEIRQSLATADVRPEEIDYIYHTHHHADHTFNDHCFPNTKVITDKKLIWDCREGSVEVLRDLNNIFPEEIYCFPTPGHTDDHFSYMVSDDDDLKWVFAGDAFTENGIEVGEVPAFYNEQAYWESAYKIASLADVIVPGHGEIITSERILELKNLIETKLQKFS